MDIPKNTLRNGLTTIELLVVISVIGILIALLFPVIGKTRQIAHNAQCISNLRQIGIGFRGYINEYGYAPPHWGNSPFYTSSTNFLWTGHLAPYLGVKDDLKTAKLLNIFDCPADPLLKTREINRGYISTVENWGISYGFNYAWLTSQKGWWREPINLRFVNNQTTLILATDSTSALIHLHEPKELNKVAIGRHYSGMFNTVFLDGHVQALDADKLKRPEYWQPLQ